MGSSRLFKRVQYCVKNYGHPAICRFLKRLPVRARTNLFHHHPTMLPQQYIITIIMPV